MQGREEDCNEDSNEKDMSHVRSLMALDVDAFQWMPPLSSFSALRVLALGRFSSKRKHLNHLGSLAHLRYLKLGGSPKKEIVEEIGKLQHLKISDLKYAFIRELPASIVQLTELECLLTNRRMKFPDGMGNLVPLQELSELNVEESPNTVAELGKLTELRVLKIRGSDKNDSSMMTFLQSLSNLGNIRSLYFSGDEFCTLGCVPDDWRAPAHLQRFNGGSVTFYELPRWFSSLSELSYLSIWVEWLIQDDLQLLGALPVLRFLKLQVGRYGGTAEEQFVIGGDHPFQSLTEFWFENHTGCWLFFGQGAMPKLLRLELYFRADAGHFDVGLENLTSLKHVTCKVACFNARTWEVENAEHEIRNALSIHPNHPTLEMSRQ